MAVGNRKVIAIVGKLRFEKLNTLTFEYDMHPICEQHLYFYLQDLSTWRIGRYSTVRLFDKTCSRNLLREHYSFC